MNANIAMLDVQGCSGNQANTHWLITIGSDTRSYDPDGNTVSATVAGEAWRYVYDGYTA
ncbi:hypothetical protein [Dyella nitratireducens]|uniref:Uncharacterized protein n=1 Tax=Dyella nitratireducens TaxID=1849580 RepID=A0ABQ1FZ79_9GAMM|nr:hypothetical protein [Dyella nitratireducens]GGA33513.1 hypothetical protein GCM10010981_23040 [Dyella nitratireducens]GLQ40738.1 hypothetical protein GCM10007902_05880 [Dyella nitratireducens]